MDPCRLFETLKRLELPAGDYAVFGSGPLAARGLLSNPEDLDVLCRADAWQMVLRIAARRGVVVRRLAEYDAVEVVELDGLSFGTRWGIGHFDTDELIETAEWIDGLPFVRLEHVVTYKRIRRSERDREHLDLLAEFQSVVNSRGWPRRD